MTEQMQGDHGNIELERDFYGFAGAGPLTVSLYHDEGGEGGVHLGWGDGGMYLTPVQARALARFLVDVAGESNNPRPDDLADAERFPPR
jgi:hypothetical protein